MALVDSNAKVLCLMALLMISTSFLSSQASGRNIGMEANIGTELYREPYIFHCEPEDCNRACQSDRQSAGHCHPDNGCYCDKEANIGTEQYREPYIFHCEPEDCNRACQTDRKSAGHCHPDNGCYCDK